MRTPSYDGTVCNFSSGIGARNYAIFNNMAMEEFLDDFKTLSCNLIGNP
jgi:hypothetical protein